MSRRGLRAIAAVTIVMAVVLGLLWGLQRRLIYFPDRTAPPIAAAERAGARQVWLETRDDLRLGAWLTPPTSKVPGPPTWKMPKSGIVGGPGTFAGDRRIGVLVMPGNAGNRGGRLPLATALAAEGLTVLLLDYRGYGGNPGTPSERGLAHDARAGWDHLTGEVGLSPGRVLLFGESLGAAVATGLAAELGEGAPGGLVLRSPFASLTAVGREHYPLLPVGLLLRDRYEVLKTIPRVTAPTAVVYGTADTIVPPEQSASVARHAGNGVLTSAVPDADHNDAVLLDGPEVVGAVVSLAERLGEP
jgi:pimeloyl-ACP methyl ester carboxylesterase